MRSPSIDREVPASLEVEGLQPPASKFRSECDINRMCRIGTQCSRDLSLESQECPCRCYRSGCQW